jgi:hypothetical protein
MAKKLFTIISFFPPGDARQPCKYRNISNIDHYSKFALKAGFAYSNIYEKETRQYWGRKYHQDIKQ